jgi:hypothetical protein
MFNAVFALIFLVFFVLSICRSLCSWFVLWCPLLFWHRNDVRVVFASSCVWEGSCLIYVVCVCLRIVVSKTYCVVFLLYLYSSCVLYMVVSNTYCVVFLLYLYSSCVLYMVVSKTYCVVFLLYLYSSCVLYMVVSKTYCVVCVFCLRLVHGGIQHILWCVFVLFVFVLCQMYPMLPVSLDCPFLIIPSVSLTFIYVDSFISFCA